MDDYDKTCLESALLGVCNIVQQEWGAAIPCQVCLIFTVQMMQHILSTPCKLQKEMQM